MGQLITDRPLFFPDIENVIAIFLEARPELDGVAVGVGLPPNFDGTQRAVVVTRRGGAFLPDDGLDNALARIEIYGPGKSTAHVLAGVVRGVLLLLPQATHAGGVVVSEVEENQGPYWAPDRKRNDANRYVMRYRLVVVVRTISV